MKEKKSFKFSEGTVVFIELITKWFKKKNGKDTVAFTSTSKTMKVPLKDNVHYTASEIQFNTGTLFYKEMFVLHSLSEEARFRIAKRDNVSGNPRYDLSGSYFKGSGMDF